MNYYVLIDTLANAYRGEANVNTVTTGTIDEVNINRMDIMSLYHIICNNASFTDNTIIYNISIIGMDAVDIVKKETTNKLKGNDNELDVFNQILLVHNRIFKRIKSGDLFSINIDIENNSVEPFTERFENFLSGWTFTFDLIVENNMTSCDG
jgi:hypothetical protein